MPATVSPHDATAKTVTPGDNCFIKTLHTVWDILSYPFITTGELKWATGILSVNDDFETCATTTMFCSRAFNFCSCLHLFLNQHFLSGHNANACLLCSLPYIAAKMVTDINDGFNICSIPQEQIARVLYFTYFSRHSSAHSITVFRSAMWLHI
jgi:hypothetical protein